MARTGKDQYLIEDAIERVIRDYRQRGYSLTRNFSIGTRQVDLVAKKGDEVVLFEFKTPKENDEAAIRQILEYSHSVPNRKFQLVMVTPPKDKSIEIIGLDNSLSEYLIEHFPSDLDTLSTHTRIEEVSDVEITFLEWSEEGVRVKGTAVVTVSLQFGSDREAEGDPEMSDTYPFEFDVTLDSERGLETVHTLDIDTSSFHE